MSLRTAFCILRVHLLDIRTNMDAERPRALLTEGQDDAPDGPSGPSCGLGKRAHDILSEGVKEATVGDADEGEEDHGHERGWRPGDR